MYPLREDFNLMIPLCEIRKELEKSGAINPRPLINFVKKHKIMAAGTLLGVPLALSVAGELITPYMAIQQGKQLKAERGQLKNSMSQLKLEDQQIQLLNHIARSTDKPEQPRMKIEPLA
jgi:hypothetical protein